MKAPQVDHFPSGRLVYFLSGACSDVRETAPAEDLAFQGQPASLVVSETQPSGRVRRTQNPILLEQVVNDCLVLPVDPARDKQEEEGEWARQLVHGDSLPEGPPGCKRWHVVFSAV